MRTTFLRVFNFPTHRSGIPPSEEVQPESGGGVTRPRQWRTFWRGKTCFQLMRGVMVYVWPLSILGRLFYRLRWSTPCYQIINRQSRRVFASIPQPLHPLGNEAVKALSTDGIFRSSVEALAQDSTLFHELSRDAHMLLAGQDVQRKIRQRYNPHDAKWYVVRAIGHRARRPSLPSSFIRFFLHPQILSIASAYLGLQVRLNYTDVWHNIPVRDGEPPISAEFWHRDHEDKRLIKLFVFLTDVDETMGPFTYVKRSQLGGEFGHVFPAIPPTGRYPEQDVLGQLIEDTPLHSVSCVGPAGSTILCDTSGLHRGGRSVTKPRIVLVGVYTSNAGMDAARYALPRSVSHEQLSPAAKFALYS